MLGPRPEVKVTVTPKMVHNTLHPKMNPEFEIPTFNSMGGMLRTLRHLEWAMYLSTSD